MPNYSLDDSPDFWQSPDRFRTMFEKAHLTGTRTSFFALGDANDDNTPVALVLQMEPGFVITRHAHACERFEVIVRGTLRTGDCVLRPGDVMTSSAFEFYGPKVAGEDGCTTIEIFANATGAHNRLTEGVGGEIITTNLLEAFETAFASQIERRA